MLRPGQVTFRNDSSHGATVLEVRDLSKDYGSKRGDVWLSSREIALEYARHAREHLNGELYREELETLTDLVVDRES